MIIEKIDRSGHVIDVYSFESNRVSIGRGYSNDIVLQDVYADEFHGAVEFDYLADAFVVKDLGSLNGVNHCRGKKTISVVAPEAGFLVQSGEAITLGKTRLRLLKNSHVVEPAKLLSSLDGLLHKLGSWWFFILMVAGILLLETLSTYMADPFSTRPYKDMAQSLYIFFAAICYGGIWLLVARTQRQDGRFLLHANVLLFASVLVSLYVLVYPVLAFNMEWLVYRGYLTKFLISMGLFVAVYISCYQSTNLSRLKRMSISLVLPCFVMLGFIVTELNRPRFFARPPYNMVLVAPIFQWRSSSSEINFLKKAEALYKPAEKEQDE